MRKKTTQLLFTLPLSLPLLLAGSCTSDRLNDGTGGVETGTEDMSVSYDIRTYDLPRNRDAACASVKAEASLSKKPVDIIFTIDNSGSMTEEALAVQNNINMNFANIIQKSGLDYRVIMVTRHGKYNGLFSQAICVAKPLSTVASCSPPPAMPGNNPPQFYHYSRQIESNDAFQRLLNTYNGAEKDDFSLAPMGWSQWLRADAFKVFVVITDDESGMDEVNFEAQLLAKSPAMFGDKANRNYVWHSIVGLHENSPPTKAWGPGDPIQSGLCTRGGGAEADGQTYQRLSILTGGLRFPICEHASFDAVFTSIATGVIAGAKVACDFPMPAPPLGETIDPESVIVEYTPMGTGTPWNFKKVDSVAQCLPNSFYIDKDKDRIYMCPETCKAVQQDDKAKLNILFDCLNIIA